MTTIQMTIDEDLLEQTDRLAEELHTSRSSLTRQALRAFIEQHRVRLLEERHREGYLRSPEGETEFSVWAAEQAWDSDEW